MMNRGHIKGTGVMPPEACVPAIDFLKTIDEVYDLTGTKDNSASAAKIILEMIDRDGRITPIDISQFGII